MTGKKRFTMCHEQNDLNGWTMSIVDWETEQPFDYTIYEVHSSSITSTKDELEDLCLLLNQLNDENNELKAFKEQNIKQYTKLKKVCNNHKRENEQLKQNISIILKYCREKGKYAMNTKEMEAHNVLQRIVNKELRE